MPNNPPINTGMILAAGQGSRMRELTKNIPKPLLKIHNKTLIEYRLEAYKNAGIKNIVINVALENHGQQIIDTLGDGSRHGVNIQYSIEEKALGTGGGIVKALPLFGNAKYFWVCGADVWTDYIFSTPSILTVRPEEGCAASRLEGPTLNAPHPTKILAHLILVPNPDHNTTGDFGLKNGLLLNTPRTFTFSGIVLYHRDLFKNAPAGNFHVIDLVRNAIDQQRVSGELHKGLWVDVGTPERLDAVNSKVIHKLN